jgi:hypothetical protein
MIDSCHDIKKDHLQVGEMKIVGGQSGK